MSHQDVYEECKLSPWDKYRGLLCKADFLSRITEDFNQNR